MRGRILPNSGRPEMVPASDQGEQANGGGISTRLMAFGAIAAVPRSGAAPVRRSRFGAGSENPTAKRWPGPFGRQSRVGAFVGKQLTARRRCFTIRPFLFSGASSVPRSPS
jgi:hypothetical protein